MAGEEAIFKPQSHRPANEAMSVVLLSSVELYQTPYLYFQGTCHRASLHPVDDGQDVHGERNMKAG